LACNIEKKLKVNDYSLGYCSHTTLKNLEAVVCSFNSPQCI